MGLIAALEWLEQPYYLCRVDMLGEMREPSYARLNARHETPVLITDKGLPLSETMAIAAWLVARDVERKISFEPTSADADRLHQLMTYINTGFTSAFSPLWAAMEMSSPDPLFQQALTRFGQEAVIERHDKLEVMLSDHDFLLGDCPTLADGILIGVARWLEFHQVARPDRWPKLAKFRTRIEATPAVQFALAIEKGHSLPSSATYLGHVPLKEVIAQFGVS